MESDERERPDRVSAAPDTAATPATSPAEQTDRLASSIDEVVRPLENDPGATPGKSLDAPSTAAPALAPAEKPEVAADSAPALNEPPNAVVTGDPALSQRIVETLRSCYDPEIPVDIWELGLVYKVDIDPKGNVALQMTLTSPMCPVAGSLPPEVESKVARVEGVRDARVDLVWEPTWNKDMMSQAAMVKLNLM